MGKIGYKNGLQVSVGHLRVPGAGDENLCLKKIMKLEYMYINDNYELSDEEKEQVIQYQNGARNKQWMLNRCNLKYIVDNRIYIK